MPSIRPGMRKFDLELKRRTLEWRRKTTGGYVSYALFLKRRYKEWKPRERVKREVAGVREPEKPPEEKPPGLPPEEELAPSRGGQTA